MRTWPECGCAKAESPVKDRTKVRARKLENKIILFISKYSILVV
jgi:hypothetical protein